MLDDASRHELLTAVAALAHQGAAEPLHDGALRVCNRRIDRNEGNGATGRHR